MVASKTGRMVRVSCKVSRANKNLLVEEGIPLGEFTRFCLSNPKLIELFKQKVEEGHKW